LVNNSQSHHKSLAQLCHQELVEHLQHFFRIVCFTRNCIQVFSNWRKILYLFYR